MTDAGGETRYEYNPFGEITKEIKLFSGNATGSTITTAYEFDEGGNVTKITYPSGREVIYARDLLGRISSITADFRGDELPAETLVHTVTYHPYGPLKSRSFGNNLIKSRPVDSLYRLDDLTLMNGPLAVHNFSYNYDNTDNIDLREDLTNNSGDSVFTYDDLERLDSASNSLHFGSFDYEYDLNGNRSLMDENNVANNLFYEPITNRLSEVKDANNSLLSEYETDLAGRITEIDHVNEPTKTFEFSSAGRLQRVLVDLGSGNVEIVSYLYNGLGQRASKLLSGSSEPTLYVYSTAGQLLAELDASGVPTVEYIYFDSEPVAMLGSDRDGDGKLDTNDNCVAAKNNDQRDSNGDGFGNQCDPDLNDDMVVNFLDHSIMTSSAYWQQPACPAPCHEDLNGDGQVNFFDLSILGAMFFQPPGPAGAGSSSAQSGTFYIHTDHLGTPIKLTNNMAAVVWKTEQRAFGSTQLGANPEVLTFTDPDGDATHTVFNFRFPGQYYDSETGLHYNYFRYYDPLTGRYSTSDPIGLLGGLNTFGYVVANPLIYTDPFGLQRAPSSVNGYPTRHNGSTRNYTLNQTLELISNAQFPTITPNTPVRPPTNMAQREAEARTRETARRDYSEEVLRDRTHTNLDMLLDFATLLDRLRDSIDSPTNFDPMENMLEEFDYQMLFMCGKPNKRKMTVGPN